MRRRLAALDVLRMLLAAHIVMHHFFPYPWPVEWLSAWYRIDVPVFMLLSFYLNGRYLACEGMQGAGLFLKRRLWRLVFPILFWNAAAYLYLGCPDFNMKAALRLLLFGNAYDDPLYFLAMSVYFTIFTALIARFSATRRQRWITYAAMSIVCWGVLNSGAMAALPLPPNYGVGLISNFFNLMPYAFLGIVIWEYEQLKPESRFNRMGRSAIPFLLLFSLIGPWLDLYNTGTMHGYQGFGKIVAAVCILKIGLIYRGWRPGAGLEQLIARLAPLSLGCYCMHYVIGEQLLSLVLPVLPGFLAVHVITVVCFLISFAATWKPNPLEKAFR